jgi:8-amino-7-oxononanoate synthase
MMTSLNQFAAEELSLLDAKGQRRTLPDALLEAGEEQGAYVLLHGRKLLNFSSNDYFGLSTDPRVINAAVEATKKLGTGGRASRLVCGNYEGMAALEATLAKQKNTEAALVFSSGYAANIGTITALMGKADLILADKLAHACLLDGARLSGATLMRFAHNNVQHLEQLLEAHRAEFAHCLIITESIFSMDGDVAPISEIAALAGMFGAWMLVDDAHGLGLTSQLLKPIALLDGVIQTSTLSKAAGSLGGVVAGSKPLVEYVLNHARSFIYSTALPPAVVAAAVASLAIMEEDKQRTHKPLRLARFFTHLLALPEAQSPIVPMVLGENDKALKASADLMEKGFYVRAIRPPTVPPNTARLRITFTSLHTEEQVAVLAEAVKPWLE